MNESLFAIHILTTVLLLLAALRLGKDALIAWIALQGILANVLILKQVELFGMTVTTCDGTGCTGQADVVQVQVPYQFTLVAPVLNLVCGGSCPLGTVNLTSTSRMRNE